MILDIPSLQLQGGEARGEKQSPYVVDSDWVKRRGATTNTPELRRNQC